MKPTIAALFSRSGYSRRTGHNRPDEESEQLQEQHERFTAAALGFALWHEKEFLSHFLRTICEVPTTLTEADWTIDVEPRHEQDLVLEANGGEIKLVIELKVGAKLASHQNPSKPTFLKAGGYGSRLKTELEHGDEVRYITVEKKASWKTACGEVQESKLRGRCQHKAWCDLRRKHQKEEGPLEGEICDWLGHSGVPGFMGRDLRMKGKKLGNQATNVLDLLYEVFKSLEIEGAEKARVNAYLGGIGLNIWSKDFKYLSSFIGAKKKTIGWFGYEHRPSRGGGEKKNILSVWFYCQAGVETPKDSAKFHERLRAAFRKAGFEDPIENGADWGVICDANDSEDDLAWFTKVLRTVQAAAKEHERRIRRSKSGG